MRKVKKLLPYNQDFWTTLKKSAIILSLLAPSLTFADSMTLRIGSTRPIKTTHPYDEANTNDTGPVTYLLNRPLLAIDSTWKWTCVLCKSIPTVEAGTVEFPYSPKSKKKFMRTSWELRGDLAWGDGKPVTAGDVVFSWQLAKELVGALPQYYYLYSIDSIEVDKKNPLKFVINFIAPTATFYKMAGLFIIPRHLEEDLWKKDSVPANYLANSRYAAQPGNGGLYNGPYIFSGRDMQGNFLFTRSAYFRPSAKIEKVEVVIYKSKSELANAVFAQKINMVLDRSLPASEVLEIEKKSRTSSPDLAKQYEFLYKDNSTFEHIDFNMRNPILADRVFRKALLHATNRSEIVSELFKGAKNPALHSLNVADPFYAAASAEEKLAFAPKTAEKLLDELGWKVGEGGFRFKDEQKLTLSLDFIASDETRRRTAALLKTQWRALGIDLITREIAPADFASKTIAKAQFSDLVLFSWEMVPSSAPVGIYHSKEIPTFENNYDGQNISAWRNKSVDKFLDRLAGEFDEKKRLEDMQNILREFVDDAAAIPLYFDTSTSIIPVNLQNFQLTGHDAPATLWAEYWQIN